MTATLLLTGASALLAGCGNGGLSQTFGFTRASPDEFTVATQAPLSMPPNFALRPPRPGEARPQDMSQTSAAEQALIPQTALGGTPAAGMSAGQQALLQQAGPPAPAGIRREIRQDNQQAANESFADKLLFWRQPKAEGIVVDPQKEAQRLRQNAALGESPDAGDTQIIQPHRKGWLEGLF